MAGQKSFDITNFNDPRVMSLMGLAQGLLASSGYSARPISTGEALANGLQGGMQGYMQGQHMQQNQQDFDLRNMQAQSAHNEAMRKLNEQHMMEDTIKKFKDGGSRKDISQALIGSGMSGLIETGLKLAPKVKTTAKGLDAAGNPVIHIVYDTGETDTTGIRPAERAMQVNTGNQMQFLDPYSLQQRGQALPISMNPGQAAQLAQSANQFNQSHGLAQQRMQMEGRNAVQPKLVDGAWVYPPTADSPQGSMVQTEMYVPPKGSISAQKTSSEKTNNILDEADKYISGATGSVVGNLVDMGAGALGVATPGAQDIARLKTLEAGLVMNMPRLEGPQSNLDQQLYREAAGQIGNPNVPQAAKRAALETIRRIQNNYAGKQPTAKGGASGSFDGNSENDGWGELR